jgi:hypothetical protein
VSSERSSRLVCAECGVKAAPVANDWRLDVTRDRSTHWRAKPKVACPEIDFGRGAAAFTDGRGLVLLGRGGGEPTRLLATGDCGRTWRLARRWR